MYALAKFSANIFSFSSWAFGLIAHRVHSCISCMPLLPSVPFFCSLLHNVEIDSVCTWMYFRWTFFFPGVVREKRAQENIAFGWHPFEVVGSPTTATTRDKRAGKYLHETNDELECLRQMYRLKSINRAATAVNTESSCENGASSSFETRDALFSFMH